jgi:excisionase family DNA binding protein
VSAAHLLTYAEAGVWLGNLSAKTVMRLVKQGELPAVRIGKYVRFRPVDLDRYADAHLTDQAPAPGPDPAVFLGRLPAARGKGRSA